MRLLVDANLSPVVAARLRRRACGHPLYDVRLAEAIDEQIVEYARDR